MNTSHPHPTRTCKIWSDDITVWWMAVMTAPLNETRESARREGERSRLQATSEVEAGRRNVTRLSNEGWERRRLRSSVCNLEDRAQRRCADGSKTRRSDRDPRPTPTTAQDLHGVYASSVVSKGSGCRPPEGKRHGHALNSALRRNRRPSEGEERQVRRTGPTESQTATRTARSPEDCLHSAGCSVITTPTSGNTHATTVTGSQLWCHHQHVARRSQRSLNEKHWMDEQKSTSTHQTLRGWLFLGTL